MLFCYCLVLFFIPSCVNLDVSFGLWFVYNSKVVHNEERTIPNLGRFWLFYCALSW
jgi:hypothetical protein